MLDTGILEVPAKITGSVGELGEDQYLAASKILLAEQRHELCQLVIAARLETTAFVEEGRELIEVQIGFLKDLADVVLVSRQLRGSLEQLRRNNVLFSFIFAWFLLAPME